MSEHADVLSSAQLSPPSALPSQREKSSIASRLTSPTKPVADLATVRPPIKFLEAGNDNEGNQPEQLHELCQEMVRARKGFGLLPLILKVIC
jgi:hypothetical protein